MAATRGVTAPMGRRTLLLVSALLIAALGSALVYLYAQSADARAREGLEMRRILVATEDIPEGTPVAQAETNLWFQSREINAEAVVDGALSSIDPIRDQVALVDIYDGEQILSDKFGAAEEASGPVPLTDGNLAMTVSLGDPQRVVNFVTPGSSVAIFLTGPTRDGEEGTSLLLDRVRVAGVGDSTSPLETASTGGQQSGQTPSALLTLDVTQAQAQKIIFAQTQGVLYLGLVNAASSVDTGQQATTSGNLFN
jgi:pilus assembly protein CpaB